MKRIIKSSNFRIGFKIISSLYEIRSLETVDLLAILSLN